VLKSGMSVGQIDARFDFGYRFFQPLSFLKKAAT
jgi:hypothetical protein